MQLLFTFLFFMMLKFVKNQAFTNVKDVQVLSELSLGKLLALKRTFEPIEDYYESNENISRTIDDVDIGPHAMALQAKKSPKDRGGYYHTTYHYDISYKKDKKGIQSIFQLSVTTLAFLAFGAYLVCLVIHAIKGKSDYYMSDTAAQMMATFLANRVRKRRVSRKNKKRRQTTRKPQRYVNVKKRPSKSGNKLRPRRSVLEEEDLYEAFVGFAEVYTDYHTVNYGYFNSSFNEFY